MRWKNVYCVQYPGAAERALDWLLENDIDAQIRGQALIGAMGEVPTNEAWPSVWVPMKQRELAEALIARLDAAANTPQPDWSCPGCGERVEGSFGSCWSCGTDSPAVAAL